MAITYAVGAGDIMRPLHGDFRILRAFPEDATQSFLVGDLLIAGGAGVENKVKVAADNPTAAIVGVAAENASGVTGNLVMVWCALPFTRFVARAVAADGLDYSDLGTARALQKHGTHTHLWVVDTSDAGNDSAVVRDYRSPDGRALAEGDFEMEVIFDFKLAATVWGSET